MKRFSMLFALPVVFALCFGTTAATPARALDAGFAASPVGHHHHYDVYYGTCDHDLRFYRAYDCLDDARHAAFHLQQRGYWTQIRHG